MIDKKAIEEHIRGILKALGDNPDREGLKETPERVAKMYEEVFEGMNYTNHEIAEMFGKTFEDGFEKSTSDSIVVVKDIDFFSYCEHHMALMYDMKATVAYIPKGKVVGLSKIARVVDMVGRRLQLQEKIGMDIADGLKIHLEFEPRAGEGVAIAGKYYTEVAGGGMNFDGVGITAPIHIVPNPCSIVVDGQVVVRVDVGIAPQDYRDTHTGVQVHGLVAVVMIVVGSAGV